jgi:TPR repeat protein
MERKAMNMKSRNFQYVLPFHGAMVLFAFITAGIASFSEAARCEPAGQELETRQTAPIMVTESKRSATQAAAKALKPEDVPELQRKGEAGDAEAQLVLGLAYWGGFGVEKNTATAFGWLRRAAEQGHPMAQSSLGVAYRDGAGTTQDSAEALRWMRKAAEQGYAQAHCNIGIAYYRGDGVPADPAEAVKWYRKAIDQGNACAQTWLGIAFAQGKGVSKDPKQAADWFRQGAEQGDSKGQLNLALAYDTGFGVPVNHGEAARWYRAAADQNDLAAMFNLAMSYHNGQGVPKSMDETENWLKKASDAGWAPASFYLGKIYADKKFQTSLTGSIALALFEKSAAQGYSLGALILSDIYSSRLTSFHLWTSRDDKEACHWLLVARELNKQDRWEWFKPDDSATVRKEVPERISKMQKKFKEGFADCEQSAAGWLKARLSSPKQ